MSLVIEANERQTNSVVMSNSLLWTSPDFSNLLIMPDVWKSWTFLDLASIPVAFSVNWTNVNFVSFSVAQWRSEMPIWWKDYFWKSSFVWHTKSATWSYSQTFNCVIDTKLIWWEIIWKKIIYRLIYGNSQSNASWYANVDMRAFLLHTDWTKTYIWNSVNLWATSNFADTTVLVWTKLEETSWVIAQAWDYVGVEYTYHSTQSTTSARAYQVGRWSSGGAWVYVLSGSGAWSYWYPCPIEISIE